MCPDRTCGDEIDLSKGKLIEATKDGKKRYRMPNGSVVTTAPKPKGFMEIIKKSGEKITTWTDEHGQKHKQIRLPNGELIWTWGKGNKWVEKPNGVIIYTSPEKGGYIEIIMPDGVKRFAWTDKKGVRHKAVRRPNGGYVETWGKGYKLEKKPDGTTIYDSPEYGGFREVKKPSGEKIVTWTDQWGQFREAVTKPNGEYTEKWGKGFSYTIQPDGTFIYITPCLTTINYKDGSAELLYRNGAKQRRKDTSDSFKYTSYVAKWIKEEGPSNKKVDVVIFSEGYLEEDLREGGLFDRHVEAVVKAFSTVTVYRYFRKAFNVKAVSLASSHAGIDENPGEDKVKSPFNCCHNGEPGRPNILACQNIRGLSELVDKIGNVDVIVLLVNEKRVGEYGGGIPIRLKKHGTLVKPLVIISPSRGFGKRFVRAFSQAFAGLGPEYEDEAAASLWGGTEERLPYANLQRSSTIDKTSWAGLKRTLKWGALLDRAGPEGEIGAFEGGYYVSKGVCRPQKTGCLMRDLTSGMLCHICRREVFRRIYYYAGKKFDDEEYFTLFPMKKPKGEKR
jgi:hypothetical protein